MEEYARRVAYWAWACFWLAVQLRHKGIDHQGTCGKLEEYLSSMAVVCETKDTVIHEALGRAYGMRIYPLGQMEVEEVLRAIGNFGTVVTEIQAVLAKSPGEAAITDAAGQKVAVPHVTLVQFIEQYCQDGDKLAPSSLISRRNSIQHAAHFGTITLPDHVGNWRPGQSKYYRPSDLAELWDQYCKSLSNLPPLKAKPPSGGQTD